jgi:hypothetical protein
VNNPNNPTHTAGTTFFGQFLDHDITFDASSPLGVPPIRLAHGIGGRRCPAGGFGVSHVAHAT